MGKRQGSIATFLSPAKAPRTGDAEVEASHRSTTAETERESPAPALSAHRVDFTPHDGNASRRLGANLSHRVEPMPTGYDVERSSAPANVAKVEKILAFDDSSVPPFRKEPLEEESLEDTPVLRRRRANPFRGEELDALKSRGGRDPTRDVTGVAASMPFSGCEEGGRCGKAEAFPAVDAEFDRAVARTKLNGVYIGGVGMDDDGETGCKAELSPEERWTQANRWTVDIHDSKDRSPAHPEYDATSLRIPPAAYRRLTPFQRQFWDIKCRHFDVMLMFKKGKFYEMYDRDADIGYDVLGLSYTGGGRVDMRCVGVPEQAFSKHAVTLVEAGYKVGRVEQVETINAAKQRRSSGADTVAAKSTICERTLVKILTRGTISDESLLSDRSSRYVLALHESPPGASADGSESLHVGVCFVDVAANAVKIGEFADDRRGTWLETLTTLLRPQEIVLARGAVLSESTERLCRLQQSAGVSIARVSEDDRTRTSAALEKALGPDVREYIGDGHRRAEMALQLCASYLRYLQIEEEVFSMGNIQLQTLIRDGQGSSTLSADGRSVVAPSDDARMILDGAALDALEVLRAGRYGSERGALISFVDHTVTPDGARLLRGWLARPLYSSDAINRRLDAVELLLLTDKCSGGHALRRVRAALSRLPDLERGLARVHAAAAVEDRVVMFDDTNSRRVVDFVCMLKGVRAALELIANVRRVLPPLEERAFTRVDWLVNESVPSDAGECLNWFYEHAMDFAAAERGEMKPLHGDLSDRIYTDVVRRLEDVERSLEHEIDALRARLSEPRLQWFHRGKEGYQIEVPARWLERNAVPAEFVCLSQGPNCTRYWTPRVQRLFHERVGAVEGLEIEQKRVLRRVLQRFDEHWQKWAALAGVVAELDALLSLAAMVRLHPGALCRPQLLPNDHPTPLFRATQCRHPTMAARLAADVASTAGGSGFVANDVVLGGERHERVMVLTGPNMGGKSTVLRQTCLVAILAQIGSYVPASECALTPIDRIFTRVGAHDVIAAGRSTFLVEMEETAAMLHGASRHSLLILDELGRGTSTFDGYAIAHAVLRDIARRGCLALFSTHYHMLTQELSPCRQIALYEMACEVDERRKLVTFLYALRRGVAPYSRGIDCARLARVPAAVADGAERHAAAFARAIEARMRRRRRRLRAENRAAVRQVLELLAQPIATTDAQKRMALLQERGVDALLPATAL